VPEGGINLSAALFCDLDLQINPKPKSVKLERDLDILKLYLHTENEAASLRHSKLGAWIEQIRKYVSRSK